MNGHARLAPSSAPIWVPCPGSVQQQETYPEVDDGSGDEGNIAHDIAANILNDNPMSSDDQEMMAAINLYVSNIRKIAGRRKVHCELPVDISHIHKDCWGTLDCRWFDTANDILHIFDLKYGWGIVEAFMNWQLILYAIGSLTGIKATNVWIHIIQPRPPHSQGPHRVWKTTAVELWELANRASESANLALSPNPPLYSGGHCRRCSALYTCDTARSAMLNAVDVAGKGISPAASPGQIGFELALLRRAKEMIDHRLAAVDETALAMDRAGTNIPGFVRQFSGGRLNWQPGRKDEIKAMAEMYGVDVEKHDLKTPTQSMDAGLPKEVVAMYSKRGSGTAKLVPVTDQPTLIGGMFKDA